MALPPQSPPKISADSGLINGSHDVVETFFVLPFSFRQLTSFAPSQLRKPGQRDLESALASESWWTPFPTFHHNLEISGNNFALVFS